jgi:phosphonate transport system permease protein
MTHDVSSPDRPKVSPWIAALGSLLLPGLGQIYARHVRRGLILLGSFATILILLIWRIRDTAQYDTEPLDILLKAFHLDSMVLITTILFLLLYVWIIVDAHLLARNAELNKGVLFLVVILVFFALGWQIGEINLVTMVTQADDAWPALQRVLWPWERAITYPEELLVVRTQILSPCTDVPFTPPQFVEGAPYLTTDPTCGIPSEQDGAPGTELHISGGGFATDVKIDIWWNDPIGNEFRQRQGGEYVSLMADENGKFEADIIMPYRLLPPSAGEGPKIWELQARQVANVGKAEASVELKLAVEKIIETIFIGMIATFFGIILSLPLSFLAARNLMSSSKITLAIYYFVRTIMNLIRSIEPLIWAIIFVIVVGLGPFAGILALTVHSMAALGKLYSEAIESIDPGPIEAIQATGANWIQVVMYAVVPQVIPPFVSFTIYRWDINIRMSTIIGFVGGGGIGFLLAQWIRLLDYRAAGIAVWFIAIVVAILDYVSAEIRARYV